MVDTTSKQDRTAPSLHGHYPLLRYYEQFRPCSRPRYSHAYAARRHLRFSLHILEQVPTFRTQARTEIMPPLCRMPHGQSAHSRHAFPEDDVQTPVLTSFLILDTCSAVHFRSSSLSPPNLDVHHHALSCIAAQGRLAPAHASRRRGAFYPSSCVQLRGTRTHIFFGHFPTGIAHSDY